MFNPIYSSSCSRHRCHHNLWTSDKVCFWHAENGLLLKSEPPCRTCYASSVYNHCVFLKWCLFHMTSHPYTLLLVSSFNSIYGAKLLIHGSINKPYVPICMLSVECHCWLCKLKYIVLSVFMFILQLEMDINLHHVRTQCELFSPLGFYVPHQHVKVVHQTFIYWISASLVLFFSTNVTTDERKCSSVCSCK